MLDEILDKAKDMAGDVAAKVSDVVGGVFGVDAETIEILKAKYDELMADGKISKEEVFAALEEFATEKGISPEILEKAKAQNVKVFLPIDTVIADEFSNDADRREVDIYDIPEGWMGMDAGTKTRVLFHDVIMNSRTILWNGPIGVFEMPNFAAGTVALGDSIAESTELGAFSLVGGGDSVAFVKQFGYEEKVSYVSTGGGAMLESLEGKELPGVKAINS